MTQPHWASPVAALYRGDCRRSPLPDGSVHCIVSSPPYWQQRRYKCDDPGMIGLEPTLEQYVANLVAVARDCWRVLRDDGVMWWNLGDVYGGSGVHAAHHANAGLSQAAGRNGAVGNKAESGQLLGLPWRVAFALQAEGWILRQDVVWAKPSCMPESLDGTSWRRCRVKVDSKRQASQGYATELGGRDHSGDFRLAHNQDTTWQPCPGCTKCRDTGGWVLDKGSWRSTRSHEYIFQFVKRMGYFADREAVATPNTEVTLKRVKSGLHNSPDGQWAVNVDTERMGSRFAPEGGANRRSVWSDIQPQPYGKRQCSACLQEVTRRRIRTVTVTGDDGKERKMQITTCCEAEVTGHFASFPPDLPKLCVLASTSERGCCPDCGAPWARMVEETEEYQAFKLKQEQRDDSNDAMRTAMGGKPQRANTHPTSTPLQTRTLGWRATCQHPHERPVPCLIYDPFAGTGTTLLAAQRLGRRSAGMELSLAYLEQAARRLGGESLPLMEA